MPVNKPTISHQLKSVRSQRPRPTSIIHAIPNLVALSPHSRSHLVSQPRQSSYDKTGGSLIDASHLSNAELKQCTKLLRNVLSSEENKSTSTDENFLCHRALSARSVAFKSPDPASNSGDQHIKPVQRSQLIDGSDDRTDAESLTSIPDPKSAPITNNSNSVNRKSTLGQGEDSSQRIVYCSCHSTDNSHTMHDSRPPHNSGDGHRNHDTVHSVCTRCHNIIPPVKNVMPDKETTDNFHNKSSREEYHPGKILDNHFHNHNPSAGGHTDFKPSPHQYSDVTDDKIDNFMSYLHMKINELQCIARVTRDADLGRVICEIEQSFQQMVRENSLSSNHLKTIVKTLKWENSALKQKIKNQSESNRDMKSELKLIRQEQKQKIEELKLEVQLKNEEIRQMTDRDKSHFIQLKEKYSALEKEHEKLRSEFQGQILQACHKDTDIIQLKHSCSQVEAKLKDEIHSLSLINQNLKQELQVYQTQCKKHEQELNHNQLIIKAAREQVVNLLDRHKQNWVDTSNSNYRLESTHCGDSAATGEWIHQANNLQQVLAMATENRDKQSLQSKERYSNLTPLTTWSANYYSPGHQQPPDQSNLTNGSMNNFATTNFNNNYVSSSSYNPIHSDSTNPISNYEPTPFKQQTNCLDICGRSQSPSNMSSTLSDNSLNDRANTIGKTQPDLVNSRRCSVSSDSDVRDDPWSLPHPKYKISSASSMMSTVSSLRSSDDREFRKGLKRLDSQISRLQNTLQTNLRCK